VQTAGQKAHLRLQHAEVTKPLSVSDAKAAGFTILEKRCDGNYEKL
jgi:hypothetical protein